MIIVSNASPLILLSKLGQFNLLSRLFTEVLISQEVWNEVVINGAGLPGSSDVQQSAWIRLERLRDSLQLTDWQNQYNLGLGELSTIMLAKELAADLALIDERRARLRAHAEGVNVLGTVGILELGYRKGEIADLKQAYQTLLAIGARVDQRVINLSLNNCNLPPL